MGLIIVERSFEHPPSDAEQLNFGIRCRWAVHSNNRARSPPTGDGAIARTILHQSALVDRWRVIFRRTWRLNNGYGRLEIRGRASNSGVSRNSLHASNARR
jgi:hypothetical protein